MTPPCALIADNSTDFFAKIPHGDCQTILHEALLTADHNACHVGEPSWCGVSSAPEDNAAQNSK